MVVVQTWVWAITLTTLQYFLILSKSFFISFLPASSCHFLEAFTNDFFLDRYLNNKLSNTHQTYVERSAMTHLYPSVHNTVYEWGSKRKKGTSWITCELSNRTCNETEKKNLKNKAHLQKQCIIYFKVQLKKNVFL